MNYGTSHKKVSRVTQYVTLLNHCLFSMYNSITCVLRLMLSMHTHAYYEVRIRYGIEYTKHVYARHDGLNDVSCLSREKEEELSTRYSDSRGMGL